jgi:hypothetical protein
MSLSLKNSWYRLAKIYLTLVPESCNFDTGEEILELILSSFVYVYKYFNYKYRPPDAN